MSDIELVQHAHEQGMDCTFLASCATCAALDRLLSRLRTAEDKVIELTRAEEASNHGWETVELLLAAERSMLAPLRAGNADLKLANSIFEKGLDEAEVAISSLQTRLRTAEENVEELGAERDMEATDNRDLRAENTRLREALEAVVDFLDHGYVSPGVSLRTDITNQARTALERREQR